MNIQALTTQTSLPLPSFSTRVDQLLDEFFYSRDRKDSSRTLYRRILKRYFSWVESKGLPVAELTLRNLIDYKAELLRDGKTSLTVSSYISALRIFYAWAESNKLYPNVAKGLELPKRVQQFQKQPLNKPQVDALLEYFKNKGNRRDYALINLLVRTGLRTIEASRINIEDIVFKGGQRVIMVHGKGRDTKDTFVIATDKTWGPIAEYLATRPGAAPQEPLFPSVSNNSRMQRITTRTVYTLAKEGLKAIGLDDRAYTAHSLRHTAATLILSATGDLEQTRLFCRHTNPATTLIYTATIHEQRRLENSGEAVLDGIF